MHRNFDFTSNGDKKSSNENEMINIKSLYEQHLSDIIFPSLLYTLSTLLRFDEQIITLENLLKSFDYFEKENHSLNESESCTNRLCCRLRYKIYTMISLLIQSCFKIQESEVKDLTIHEISEKKTKIYKPSILILFWIQYLNTQRMNQKVG